MGVFTEIPDTAAHGSPRDAGPSLASLERLAHEMVAAETKVERLLAERHTAVAALRSTGTRWVDINEACGTKNAQATFNRRQG